MQAAARKVSCCVQLATGKLVIPTLQSAVFLSKMFNCV